MNENEQPRPIQHGAYLIIWLDKSHPPRGEWIEIPLAVWWPLP